jgi:hypothetical protein
MQQIKCLIVAIIACVVVLLISAGIFIFLVPRYERTIINGFTVLGTAVSICVLIYGKSIKRSIESTLLRYDQILSVSETSRVVELIDATIQYTKTGDFSAASIKMSEFKKSLIGVVNMKGIDDDARKKVNDYVGKELRAAAVFFNNNSKSERDKSRAAIKNIIDNLEHIKDAICDIEGKLKHKGNG